jgi:site-specific DNA-methyltransferase (adenine-specific)
MLKKNCVQHMDCLIGLDQIDSESVDIIICDPPYNIGKDFGNNYDNRTHTEYMDWCNEWISRCIRILKPNGTLYIYGFSEQLAFVRTLIPIQVRWLVWHYTNKVNAPSLHFWQRTHESILCCYKARPIFNRDEVREPYTEKYIKHKAGKTRHATIGRFDTNGEKQTTYGAHEKGALPRDVLKIPTLSGGVGQREKVGHPTQKPIELCKRLIKASMNLQAPTQNTLVIPFAGSGSECMVAKELGIDFYAFEINEDYVTLSNDRINVT